MDLNPEQNKLISDFHNKWGQGDGIGHLKATIHISDVRQLVEACIEAERNDAQTQTQSEK